MRALSTARAEAPLKFPTRSARLELFDAMLTAVVGQRRFPAAHELVDYVTDAYSTKVPLSAGGFGGGGSGEGAGCFAGLVRRSWLCVGWHDV